MARPKRPDPNLTVKCGYGQFHFNDSYPLSYFKRVFAKKLSQCPRCFMPIELFPGLELKDENGNVWKPEITVNFTKVEKPCI